MNLVLVSRTIAVDVINAASRVLIIKKLPQWPIEATTDGRSR